MNVEDEMDGLILKVATTHSLESLSILEVIIY